MSDRNGRELRSLGIRQRHGPSRGALERTMHGARVTHEVGTSPGIFREEFVREGIALQLIAANAGKNDVAGMVDSTVCEGIDVIERCRLEVQRRGAVDAAAATVPHGRTLDGTLESGSAELRDDALRSAEASGGKHDAVTLSSDGHFTSLEKATPRHGR